VDLARTLRHLATTRWSARGQFPPQVLGEIERSVRQAESQHQGEIRFAVEASLDLPLLWRGATPRQRALQAFSHLGIWDTKANNGVLIYVLLADRAVEIVADRGIAARVAQAEWDQICADMQAHFRAGRFAEGSTAGVLQVGRILTQHFPGGPDGGNELPNRPVML
jgi:uncharacterized membrane protein